MGVTLKRLGLIAALALASLCTSWTANASTLLLDADAASYTGPVIFIPQSLGSTHISTAGPVSLPNHVTYTASNDQSFIGSPAPFTYGFASNGGTQKPLIATETGSNTITLTFDHDISAFGGYFNYVPDPGFGNPAATITALDHLGNVLASYDLKSLAPISTPGATDAFAFRGIADATADIRSFQFSGAFLAMLVQVQPTPVPGALPLFLSALGGLGLFGWRRSCRENAAE